MKKFVMKPEHLALLKELNVTSNDDGIEIDTKRPFGDSSVYESIANILKWEIGPDGLTAKQEKTAQKLYNDLAPAMKVIFDYAETMMDYGQYNYTKKKGWWHKYG